MNFISRVALRLTSPAFHHFILEKLSHSNSMGPTCAYQGKLDPSVKSHCENWIHFCY